MRKTNVTDPELLKSTGPFDAIEVCNITVMRIIEASVSSRYLTNHDSQYNHIRIPINFIDSCIVFTKQSHIKASEHSLVHLKASETVCVAVLLIISRLLIHRSKVTA